MRCLINVDGGMGKNVMLTAILPLVAQKYEEVYVISPYFDIFKCCPYVTDAFPPGQGSLYQELVLDEECDVLWKEPYSNNRFIKKQCHLWEAWLEEFGIEVPENILDAVPQIDGIEDKFPAVRTALDQAKEKIGEKYIIVQFMGGHSPLVGPNDPVNYDENFEPIKRNYHDGQKLIDALKEEYPDATIVHYALPKERTYEHTVKLEMPYLAYRLLAKDAFKIVCTDSSLQHLTAGVCKDVTVIWGETRPEHFGYIGNKNICAKNVVNSQPYFKPLGTSPAIVRMPTVQAVMEEVRK